MGVMVTSDEIHRITAVLDRWFGVDQLWLYGSQAEGTARADSDVDLAALFRRRPEGLEIFDARTELEEVLRRDVDLVDLDQAPPILAMQVLKHGRLLVPSPLREKARLDKEALWAGMGRHLELWSATEWEAALQLSPEAEADFRKAVLEQIKI